MTKNNSKDLTVGSPTGLILGFSLPLLLGMLFQQVYSLMDTIIVGRFLSVSALAAVGSTGSICFLIIGFCQGVCAGFSLPIAQRFGAKDEKGLKKYVGNAGIVSVIIAIIMTALTVLLCGHILTWMNTPGDIYDLAYQYLIVIFAGIPATILYNLLSGYLRSLGNSVIPVIFLIIAAVLNIGLDLLFILVFNMGVFGAAFATALSQGVSGVLCIIYIAKNVPLLHVSRNDLELDSSYVRNLMVMGLPMGFQYSITAIGSVILQTAVNGLGSIAVASMTAASRISMFMVCPFDALGSTMATYSGQNVGAAKFERVKKGLYFSLSYRIGLFGFDFCGTAVYSQLSDLPVCITKRNRGCRTGSSVSADKCIFLHPARSGKHSPFHHTGHGLFRFCNVCRSSRNDCAFAHRTCICTDIRLFCRLLCKPTRMDSRRCLPGACIHPLPA